MSFGKPLSTRPQMACVRGGRVLGSVRARGSQAACDVCAARRRTGRRSGPKLLRQAAQTTGFCTLRRRCLSHWMGI